MHKAVLKKSWWLLALYSLLIGVNIGLMNLVNALTLTINCAVFYACMYFMLAYFKEKKENEK